MPDKEVADTLPASSVAASMKQAFRLDKLAAPFTSAFALEMEQRGLGSPRALSTIVPNLHIPDYGSAMTSSVYLRGFGSRIDNPVLGLYIDDIPILDKNLYDFDFLDIRRADLLRGPQGTLYGRNAMTGVLEPVDPGTFRLARWTGCGGIRVRRDLLRPGFLVWGTDRRSSRLPAYGRLLYQ